jgi:16S rRNA pseudouridine516 synthase
MAITRLDKYLADSGIGTRSQVKQYIRRGQVLVNGKTVTSSDEKIHSDTDLVTYQGQPVLREDYVYYLLNKPAGYISATEDDSQPTVLNLIQDTTHKDLFPVGRLDKDTEGLLLITNDGSLSHQLLSPKRHIDKVYYAETDSPIPETAIARFQEGVDIGEARLTLPAVLELLTDTSARLTIHEGKFHQVKRMFHAVGCEVTYLRRVQLGSLILEDSLPLGKYRRLTMQELDDLRFTALTH